VTFIGVRRKRKIKTDERVAGNQIQRRISLFPLNI
jgi:hypothetical protein